MSARLLTALLAGLALILTACGGSDGPDGAAPTDAPDATETETENETEDATDEPAAPVSVEDANGTVELEAPAERVVALEWTYVEDLLAVGVQPVGVADVAGYEQWVDVEPALGDDVTDVGTRQEPSLESIAALEPDLIIGVQFRHEPILDQLEAIAPTLLFNPYPEAGGELTQFDEMVQTFEAVAAAVGGSVEAAEVLTAMEATFADVSETLADAELATDRVALAQGFTAEDAPTIRMFTDNAMAITILERLGLTNAWPGEPETYGFSTVDVEALTQVGDAHFLYVAQDEDNVFTGALADNPVWQDLEFVQADRVHALGGDTWLFGGPLSAEVVAHRVAEVLTGQ